MIRKRITAAVLLVVMLLFMLPGNEAHAEGGLFGQSWFQEPEDLYFKEKGLNDINGNYVTNVRGDLDKCEPYMSGWEKEYAFERFMSLAHFGAELRYQGTSTPGLMPESHWRGIGTISISALVDSNSKSLDWSIWDEMIDARRVDDEIINYGDILPYFSSFYELYCAAYQLKKRVDAYNNANASNKMIRFKELQIFCNQICDRYKKYPGYIQTHAASAMNILSTEAAQNEIKRVIEGIESANANGGKFEDVYGNNIVEDGVTKIDSLRHFYFHMREYFYFGKPDERRELTSTGYKTYTTYVNTAGLNIGEETLAWIESATEMAEYIEEVNEKVTEIYRLNAGIIENIQLESELGLVEEYLSEMLIGVGESFSSLLATNQLVLEHIIYGRVKSNAHPSGSNVNNFSFELAPGNVYGVTGAMMYSILRGALFLGILLFFMYYLAKDAMQTSVKARSKLKENIGYILLVVALMFAMPNLIDLLLKIRDVVLQTIGNSLADGGAADINGMEKQFKMLATNTKRVADALQYFGVVFLSLYLGFIYIGMACAFTILFAGFPIFLMVSIKDHKVLNEWFNNILGIVVTPIIDAILFLIPAIAASVGGASMPNFVKLVLCMSIIPARSSIKRILGFSSSMGAELLGLGAMMAAGRAVGNVARTVRNTTGRVVEGVKGTVDDVRNSRMNRELDDLGIGAGDSSGNAGESLTRAQNTFSPDAADSNSPLNGTLSSMERQVGSAGGGGSHGFGMSGFSAGNADPAVARVLSKNAKVGNFENIAGLDPATKAKMYRNRAYQRGAKTILGAIGGVGGGLAGGAIGMGATTFMGPAAMAMGASSGMALGSEVGSAGGAALSVPVGAMARGTTTMAKGAASAIKNKINSSRMSYDGIKNLKNQLGKDDMSVDDFISSEMSSNDEPVTISNMFGSGLSREQMLDFASMSEEDAQSSGYLDFIDSQFNSVTNEEQAFDVMREVGLFAGSLQHNNPNVGYETGYLPVDSKSAIVNRIQQNVEKLGAKYDGVGYALNSIAYVDSKGKGHLGKEGYYGVGFDEYRNRKPVTLGTPTSKPQVGGSGFDPTAKDKFVLAAQNWRQKHPEANYDDYMKKFGAYLSSDEQRNAVMNIFGIA